MSFSFSQRSLDNLAGVNDDLAKVVHRALSVSAVDFAVICGMRTIEEQRELVEKGASQTMKSKHLEGKAVDLMAYIGSRATWELNVYDEIADAMKHAAIMENVGIRWGAAWTVPDIRAWGDRAEEAMNSYIDQRRSEGKRPFIDAPHFELIE